MGLSSIFRRDSADAASNGAAAPVVEDKADAAVQFMQLVMDAWDLLLEVRQRHEANAADEADAEKKLTEE
jgi:hypothetical protein